MGFTNLTKWRPSSFHLTKWWPSGFRPAIRPTLSLLYSLWNPWNSLFFGLEGNQGEFQYFLTRPHPSHSLPLFANLQFSKPKPPD